MSHGLDLYQKIQTGTALPPQDHEEAQFQMICLSWAMYYAAATEGKAVPNSCSFTMEDTRVLDHYKSYLYPRLSSHYKRRSEKKHSGMDVLGKQYIKLPLGKDTILMGEIVLPEGRKGTYVKIEDAAVNTGIKDTFTGRADMMESIKHLSHFLGIGKKKRAGEPHEVYKEKVPKNFSKWFETFYGALRLSDREKKNICRVLERRFPPVGKSSSIEKNAKEYGISYMSALVNHIQARYPEKLQNPIELTVKHAVYNLQRQIVLRMGQEKVSQSSKLLRAESRRLQEIIAALPDSHLKSMLDGLDAREATIGDALKFLKACDKKHHNRTNSALHDIRMTFNMNKYKLARHKNAVVGHAVTEFVNMIRYHDRLDIRKGDEIILDRDVLTDYDLAVFAAFRP